MFFYCFTGLVLYYICMILPFYFYFVSFYNILFSFYCIVLTLFYFIYYMFNLNWLMSCHVVYFLFFSFLFLFILHNLIFLVDKNNNTKNASDMHGQDPREGKLRSNEVLLSSSYDIASPTVVNAKMWWTSSKHKSFWYDDVLHRLQRLWINCL